MVTAEEQAADASGPRNSRAIARDGKPEIFNIDQASQFASSASTALLHGRCPHLD